MNLRSIASLLRRSSRRLADRVAHPPVQASRPVRDERVRGVIELPSFDKGGLENVVLDSAIAFDRARIEERLGLIRLEIAAVLACALHDGIADLLPEGRAEPDFTPFAEMLKANNVSHLLGVFSAMRAQVETRREFYDAIADQGARERLVAALLQ